MEYAGITRWTKQRADGMPHIGPNCSVECAHCTHKYVGFNMILIIEHCREAHREFYQYKWDIEIVPQGTSHLYERFAPIK